MNAHYVDREHATACSNGSRCDDLAGCTIGKSRRRRMTSGRSGEATGESGMRAGPVVEKLDTGRDAIAGLNVPQVS